MASLEGVFQLFKEGDDLDDFELVKEDLVERRELTKSLDGQTMKFMMRQGGQYVNFRVEANIWNIWPSSTRMCYRGCPKK